MLQLVRSMIRIRLGGAHPFSFQLSQQQDALLLVLIEVLQDVHACRRQRMLAYHNFMWTLVNAGQSQEAWNPIQRFMWLRALRADGNFYESTDFTPDLAKLKYLCNMTSLLEALLDKDQDEDHIHADDLE